MADEKAQPTPQKKEEPVSFPQILNPAYIFDVSRHVLWSNKGDKDLNEDEVVIDSYNLKKTIGHKDCMTKGEAISLAVAILKEFAPERLNAKK